MSRSLLGATHQDIEFGGSQPPTAFGQLPGGGNRRLITKRALGHMLDDDVAWISAVRRRCLRGSSDTQQQLRMPGQFESRTQALMGAAHLDDLADGTGPESRQGQFQPQQLECLTGSQPRQHSSVSVQSANTHSSARGTADGSQPIARRSN